MNRWKKAAILCAVAAAISNSSPVAAALDRTSYAAETAAINIAKHFPTNMATGVSPETPLTVEFGGAVNQSFYQTINFSLFSGTDPIDGELFYNPSARQVMFKSKQPLNAGQTYTAQLSFYDGLGRTSEKVWSFQTAGAGNNQAPAFSSAAPQQEEHSAANALTLTNANMGSGSIRPDMPLEISFSEPIDITTLKKAPVQLFEDNQPIGVDYRLSRDMKTLTVSPRNALKPGSTYAIAVEQTLASTSGSRLRKKTMIPFALEGSASSQGPMVNLHEIEEMPAPVAKAPARNQNSEIANPFAAQQAPAARPARVAQATAITNTRAATMSQPAAAPTQIVGLSPQNGSRVTNLTQPITIAFSEEVMPDTLNEFTFRLEDDFGPVPARIHYFKGNKQATLTPVGLLDSNKSYRIVVTQGITDAFGRPIRSGINAMFSTTTPAAAPAMPQYATQPSQNPQREAAELEGFDADYQDPMAEMAQVRPAATKSTRNPAVSSPRNIAMASSASVGQAPADRTVRTRPAQKNPANLNAFKVTSIFPGADANNVNRKAKIAVHFSEPADPRTVNNINISVFGNQVRVDGKVVYDRQQNRAIFEPTSPLDARTEYKVIVNDKIKSRLGEQLTQRVSWQFATSASSEKQYLPNQKTAEADSAFYIPLVDSKVKPAPAMATGGQRPAQANGSFSFVPSKHWAFKSMRHISSRGILNAFPFTYTDSVTRYEFASAINNALSNLKSMQYMSSKPRLKVNDMIQLQQLVVEFRSELKSYGVNTAWFESFLQQQGVNLQQVEARVRKLNS